MFFQGMTFAMGFGVGCILMGALVVLSIVAVEHLCGLFKQMKVPDRGIIDIGPWLRQKSSEKSSSTGFRPAS